MLWLWRHGVEWDCEVIVWRKNGWGECIVAIGSDIYAGNVRFGSCLMLSYFLSYFTFHVMTGIKNGCPCIVEIRGTKGCALTTILHLPTARAVSLTKAQPCVPPHNARATILIPLIQHLCVCTFCTCGGREYAKCSYHLVWFKYLNSYHSVTDDNHAYAFFSIASLFGCKMTSQ